MANCWQLPLLYAVDAQLQLLIAQLEADCAGAGGLFDPTSSIIPWRAGFWANDAVDGNATGDRIASIANFGADQTDPTFHSAGAANAPVLKVATPEFNGRSTLEWDGADVWLENGCPGLTQPYYVMTVHRPAVDLPYNARLWSSRHTLSAGRTEYKYNGTQWDLHAGKDFLGPDGGQEELRVEVQYVDGTQSKTWINNPTTVPDFTGNPDTKPIGSGPVVGNDWNKGNAYRGSIAAWMVVNAADADEEDVLEEAAKAMTYYGVV